MIYIDRKNNQGNIYPIMWRDVDQAGTLIKRIANTLMLQGYIPQVEQCSVDEQYKALKELLILTHRKDNEKINVNKLIKTIDLELTKKIIMFYFGLMEADNVEITTGTKVIDRNGNEHTAYSFLLADFKESMDLLLKVDMNDITNNFGNDESYNAMIEIVYKAFNRKYTKKEISKFIDGDLILKVMRVYYNLKQIA